MKKIFVPLLLLIANVCFSQVDLNLGLRAYYPFSGNANDVSGNNNNPVFNNATLTADRFGNPNSAYHFNGTDNYMQIPNSDSLNMPNKMSVALWVKATGYYTGPCYNNMLVTKSATTTLPSNFYVRFADVYNGCTAPTTTDERFSGNNTVAPTPIVNLNEWYSVVWTSDGVLERIYVNCVLKVTAFASGVPFSNGFDMFFGKQDSGTYPYWLNGDLDEIRIYDRALNQDEVSTLGGCTLTTSCNNWLSTPANPSYLTAGDIDVSGNQLTVEATVNRTPPLNGGQYYGHIVSKHTSPADINYALSLTGCEITTTNGYKFTDPICDPGLDKTYHIAMVYNGSTLKFYRNGFLMSSVPCTGNMVTNNLLTTIGEIAGNGYPPDNQFKGYINEVRIWNVARTQNELQTYMNTSLPNPATQAGLQAYYTFNNLVNKQGNNAFNAIINGSATINNTNPNCSFVADSCVVPVVCNNWLNTPTHPSTASIGNLNVTGNQITVETNFNCTSYTTSGLGFGGKLIGKHTNAANTCYALSPHAAELSTSNNGYVVTYDNCAFELNKTYHVAMVYDGTSLKFYRNGFLMSQIPCSGNISTNSLLATIGNLPNSPLITQFYGYINEIRIWNVARTQAQIQTYMNSSLPNPTTQTGLLAYYTFDNLLNKQGNAAWNATLNGGSTINNTNPNCTFIADSCTVAPTSTIINDYTPVLALNPCNNTLTVEDGSAYNVGDTVLLIQMKGAIIDSTNTSAFGTITDYKNSGNYEYNYVKSKTGNVIELSNILTRQYDIPVGRVQLIRVPYYNGSLTINDTLTCSPWDGSKGGVVVLNVRDTIHLNNDINVTGKGFRGAQAVTTIASTAIFHQPDYAYPANSVDGARKGEGITEVSQNLIFCRGALASGGGGGNSSNSGGGGGGNGGSGGKGGNEWGGTSPIATNGGLGGRILTYSGAINKIFMGGAGGAGQNNDATATNGGNGGGLIIINTNTIKPNAYKIVANGAPGIDCINLATCADGVGGGGAGGSILINAQTITSNLPVQANGGRGANNNIPGPNAHGPGGGAGGGSLLVNAATLLTNISYSATGGAAGIAFNHGNTNWGAVNGNSGISAFNFIIPFDNIPFQKNIDSVRIKDSITACLNVDFKGFGYTNTNPINSWQWYFGDGGQAITQNTAHTYSTAGTFTVKLVVTDINGCKDSVLKPVTVNICNSIVINDYTPVLGYNPCDNKLTVENGAAYNVGDTVLLIQMKGAVIDSTNTASFGTITDYKHSGNYEFNYIKNKTGNTIELSNTILKQYDIPLGKVQLIRVPYFININITDTLTCLPWDGSKGGVLVLNARDSVTLHADINVSGKGFKGSQPITNVPAATLYNQTDYAYPANNIDGSRKGEGIAMVSENLIYCRGPLASGGGGANSHNAGGGGGGNGGPGGKGGNEWGGSATILPNGGVGGRNYAYSGASNKIFMGGAGGAGHANDGTGTAGGNGGGIAIINTDKIIPNTYKIISNGLQAPDCLNLSICADGVGGGGAGGTVIINSQTIASNFPVQTNGGRGADNRIGGPNATGPGGGGGGGSLLVNSSSILTNISYSAAGGVAGRALNQAGTNWGATNGSDGISASGFIIPVTHVPFQINIDSVRIKDSLLNCNDFDFKGLAYINTSPIANWQWYFGDGGQATTQNTTHAYSTAGLYTVKLIVTDINGCTDSTLKDVNALPAVTADAGADVSICSNAIVSVTLNGTAVGGPYLWSPAVYLNNPNIQNPTATISSTTTFYLNVVGSPTCTAIDSVTITINQVPLVDTRTDTTICRLSPLVLNTSSNATTFQWSPAGNVSNPNIASPNYTGSTSGWMYVTASFAAGCSATDSLYVTVNPIPLVDTRTDTAICILSALVLSTNSNATTILWSPAASVSNPNIASPNYISTTSGWVYVTGSFASGCSATDSLYITVNPLPFVDTRPDTSICRSYPLVLNTNSNATSFQWSPAASVSNPAIANPNYIGNTSGWVYVTAYFASGCSAIDSLFVTVNATPIVDARTDTAICRSSPLVLNTNSDATTILWSPAASVSNPNIANPNYIGTTSGWVYVTGSFASGCAATDSLYVTVNPVPFVNTRPDTAICLSSPFVLSTNSDATIFQWSPASSVSDPTIANPNYTGNTSGWVYITGSTSPGCFAKDSLYVTVNPLPVVQTIADTTLCQNINITLTTTGAQTYSWSPVTGLSNPNIASPLFIGTTGQTYTVTGTDVNGCRNNDMVIVDVSLPTSFKEPPSFTICELKSVKLDGNNGNQVNYLWSPATYLSNATIINPTANPPQTTLYTLLVTDKRCGYDSVFTTLLTVVPAPVINARKSNDIDCALHSATLFASGGNQYLWSPSAGLSNANIANPVAIPVNTQTYTVLVTNATGCTNTDTVTVFNNKSASLARYMPNAFTPDGNGKNDCYGLKNWVYVQQLQFYIFNRYGEQVFGTSNPNACWNGTYKGKPALAGTYVYVIKAQTNCGMEEQKGSFLLIR